MGGSALGASGREPDGPAERWQLFDCLAEMKYMHDESLKWL